MRYERGYLNEDTESMADVGQKCPGVHVYIKCVWYQAMFLMKVTHSIIIYASVLYISLKSWYFFVDSQTTFNNSEIISR